MSLKTAVALKPLPIQERNSFRELHFKNNFQISNKTQIPKAIR